MRKIILGFFTATIFLSCNNEEVKSTATTSDSTAKTPTDLPYTARYSTNWSDNVSDADLKMVLNTYKDWTDANMAGLENALADTVEIDMSNGTHLKKPKADILKMWKSYRDSLSSVNVKMDTWHKMYATDKKEGYIVTWYDETDSFKDGRVDSASYHDINQVKDGKIVWYSQYKRPKK
ncbi:MAG: nuclear transport factor 2 family protein [Flavisolibacter sp.]